MMNLADVVAPDAMADRGKSRSGTPAHKPHIAAYRDALLLR
jgi:hypothetical protein